MGKKGRVEWGGTKGEGEGKRETSPSPN